MTTQERLEYIKKTVHARSVAADLSNIVTRRDVADELGLPLQLTRSMDIFDIQLQARLEETEGTNEYED